MSRPGAAFAALGGVALALVLVGSATRGESPWRGGPSSCSTFLLAAGDTLGRGSTSAR